MGKKRGDRREKRGGGGKRGNERGGQKRKIEKEREEEGEIHWHVMQLLCFNCSFQLFQWTC